MRDFGQGYVGFGVRPPGPDLCERWSSRLVAPAAEDRLSILRDTRDFMSSCFFIRSRERAIKKETSLNQRTYMSLTRGLFSPSTLPDRILPTGKKSYRLFLIGEAILQGRP
jgi:hypothetical protein